jgi:ribonucleoside-diphosphate reductase alpha chain
MQPDLTDYLALNAISVLPDANGNLQLDSDKLAAKAYFLEHVNPNTVFFHNLQEKLSYLVEKEYYDGEVLAKYSEKFIESAFKQAYSHNFRFPGFVSALKFYSSYAMKTTDGSRYLERFEDRVVMNALMLANGDRRMVTDLIEEIMAGRLQPATPTFGNAGKKQRGELVSCFLLRTEDNMESIGEVIRSSLQLSKRGGGVAINLTNLRERGASLKKQKNAVSGVVPVMKLLEDSFSYANQMGQRQGAGAAYLHMCHPDIVEFLDTKKENADEKIRIKTLSLGIVIPDVAFAAAAANRDLYLFSPQDIREVYGVPMTEISVTEKYEEMINNAAIRKKKVNARDLFTRIAEIQAESGYPYVLFEDTVNRAHANGGRINMSNLCVTGDTRVEISFNSDGSESLTIDMAALCDLHRQSNSPIFVSSYKDGEKCWAEVTAAAQTGTSEELIEIETEDGTTIQCTPEHQIYTKNRGWVEAQNLIESDELVLS